MSSMAMDRRPSLPPGVYFNPGDQESMQTYLSCWIAGEAMPDVKGVAIFDADVYGASPDELARSHPPANTRDPDCPHWWFFSQCKLQPPLSPPPQPDVSGQELQALQAAPPLPPPPQPDVSGHCQEQALQPAPPLPPPPQPDVSGNDQEQALQPAPPLPPPPSTDVCGPSQEQTAPPQAVHHRKQYLHAGTQTPRPPPPPPFIINDPFPDQFLNIQRYAPAYEQSKILQEDNAMLGGDGGEDPPWINVKASSFADVAWIEIYNEPN